MESIGNNGVDPGVSEQLFGGRVAQLRQQRGLTQTQLAYQMTQFGHDMQRNTITKLESGRRPTRISEVVTLALILDVEVADLVPTPEDLSPVARRLREAETAERDAESKLMEAQNFLADLQDKVPMAEGLVAEAERELKNARLELAKIKNETTSRSTSKEK